MERDDVKQASKLTKEIMLDSWEKCEKDYCPRKALDFDISVHSEILSRFSKSGNRLHLCC